MKQQLKYIFGGFVIGVVVLFSLISFGGGKVQAASSGTHTFKAANGSIKVPDHPKRIVVRTYMGQVLALKGNVVGATKWDLGNPFISSAVRHKIKDVGTPMNAEAVLKLKPDLIITDTEADVKSMSKIAPTVLLPYTKMRNINAITTRFGQLLNKQKEAKAWQKKFKQQAAKDRQRLDKAGIAKDKTVGIYELQDGKMYVFGTNFGRGGQALTTGLNFTLPKKVAEVDKGAGFKQVSIEALPQYDADYMFFTNYSSKGSGSQELKDLKANPVWKKLPAVKQGHVIQLPFQKMYYYDPYATMGQLKLVTDALLKAGK
ncbi:iron-hydroxamate ABC transporter substrate-binding protein [Agrilactobacillus fermenti]|uniref:iron-hydroxamate ABC transporter substrate-binding protein n=1 Tax=Agrilactobacillus fermenti TaxID=2586909 RepID=UPI003A5C6063